jgi:hypothetical protein
LYSDLMRAENVPANCVSWKLKIPHKIKVFMWYLRRSHSNKGQSCQKKLDRVYQMLLL